MFQTAKQIAIKSLEKIGAFPPYQEAPDEVELRRAMGWLELVLNSEIGMMPVAGYWKFIDIPLEAGVADYRLDDYSGEHQTQDVFSVSIYSYLDPQPTPLDILSEAEIIKWDLTKKGVPTCANISKGTETFIKLHKEPDQHTEDLGYKLRVRIQVYQLEINEDGTGDTEIQLRPSWYLWLINKLGYTIGTGPVRKLNENELERIENDIMSMEKLLMSNDGSYSLGNKRFIQPMEGNYW